MALLTLEDGKNPLRSKDISEAANVPLFYSSKILRSLVNAGLVHAEKGHGGGFILARKPNKIKFIEIFEAIEGKINQKNCVFGLTKCSSTNPCPLHHNWSQIYEPLQKWARETNLSDIKKGGRNPLAKIL